MMTTFLIYLGFIHTYLNVNILIETTQHRVWIKAEPTQYGIIAIKLAARHP